MRSESCGGAFEATSHSCAAESPPRPTNEPSSAETGAARNDSSTYVQTCAKRKPEPRPASGTSGAAGASLGRTAAAVDA
eukprot:1400855-Prymnesium_polylepis.2